MSRLFYHVCQDNAGNLLFDVQGTMRLAGTGTNATIYGDEALTVILPNPMTNHASFGSFKCFLGSGDYDFYMAKSGYTFETLTGVQGHGTMAQQDANDVHITGGDIVATRLGVSAAISGDALGTLRVGASAQIASHLNAGGDVTGMRMGVNQSVSSDALGTLRVGASATIETNLTTRGTVTIKEPSGNNARLDMSYDRAAQHGMVIKPDADTGPGNAVLFFNAAGTMVGAIVTTGAATAYNTTSDARLKHAITPLSGALDVVRALKPITHRWRSDDSPGVGFLAHEVAAVVSGVTTGEKDAVDEAGNIVPMQMDYAKLVPWLVSAVKELTQQVEMLQVQLAAANA